MIRRALSTALRRKAARPQFTLETQERRAEEAALRALRMKPEGKKERSAAEIRLGEIRAEKEGALAALAAKRGEEKRELRAAKAERHVLLGEIARERREMKAAVARQRRAHHLEFQRLRRRALLGELLQESQQWVDLDNFKERLDAAVLFPQDYNDYFDNDVEAHWRPTTAAVVARLRAARGNTVYKDTSAPLGQQSFNNHNQNPNNKNPNNNNNNNNQNKNQNSHNNNSRS